ncbi:MAG TPA: hypothetical protein DCR43_01650 [Bacteroidales bacterium]|nr:MAG: hypothetical protein A2X11_10600 [Bacteroidetes bacterium GWE2_42_24]OFY28128.1 MAG: hypothetical protein A2X09_00855 [Bacteroidetes bacterium GWF2_43_11]HAQ64554.1 hypothetical protein [Bacteroidales bacterium]HBZ65509.1 hypothetical protein [Bacteroidales bacterium]
MSLKIKNQFIGYVLAVFMLLALLNSAYFFLSVVKLTISEWLAFNACSLAIIAYLVCFTCFQITQKHFFLAIALVPLYYYGTMGLFVIPWNAANLFPQITHIVITLNVIWILYVLLKDSSYESTGKGLLVGVLVFVPVFAVVQNYSQLHLAEFMQMLQRVR